MTKLTFQLSEDTRLLVARLEKAFAVGDIVTYSELSEAIGKDITENRSALYSARRVVLAERGFVFATERKVGIKHLSDDEVLESTTADRKAIRGKAARAMRKLNVVDYLALTKTKQIAMTAVMAVLNVARKITTEQSIKQISSVANSQSLNFRQTLNGFRRPSSGKEEE